MLIQFLKVSLYSQCKRASLARKTNFYNITSKSIRYASSKNQDDDDELDKPIQYSTSPAASWTAAKSRNPLVLREENDIDLMLTHDLADRYPSIAVEPVSRSK